MVGPNSRNSPGMRHCHITPARAGRVRSPVCLEGIFRHMIGATEQYVNDNSTPRPLSAYGWRSPLPPKPGEGLVDRHQAGAQNNDEQGRENAENQGEQHLR